MVLYEEIFREFEKQKVKYLLVGGMAFNLLGGNRTTLDMDILVQMSDGNLRKIVSILKKLGYHVKQPVNPMDLAVKKLREDWIKNKNIKAFNFYKGDISYEEVDIVIDSPVEFNKAFKKALRVRLQNVILNVISVNDFIVMKKHSGRIKDLQDIKDLQLMRNAR